MSSYQTHLIVSLVLVAAFVVLHMAQARSDVSQKSDFKRHYCGRDLSNTLARVCYGKYNGPFGRMFKKSGQVMKEYDYPYAYDYPLMSRAIANAMLGRFGGATFRRQIRGVVDECCVKPCTIHALRTYCAAT